tara:strand:- start:957 stop:1685 length:729 start_codon:yes stop_codon:yes gene_type:complete
MPVIYSEANDGHHAGALSTDWNTTHDHTGLFSPSTTQTAYNFAVGGGFVSGRNQYFLRRSFFEFDTSGITATVASATFSLYITSTSYDNSDLIVVKSGHDPSDTTENWYSTWLIGLGGTISGWSNSDAQVVPYSGQVSAGMGAGYVDITLNSDALADLVSLSSFKIVVMNYTADYQDSAPVTLVWTGVHYADYTGTSRDPKIDYTLATAGSGYDEDVIGVAAANIGTVTGVATANVGKVIGV